MQPVNGFLRARAADVPGLVSVGLPIRLDALFTSRDRQQSLVQRHIPVPVQADLGKRVVKRSQMGHLGVGQCAVYVKDQCLEHGVKPFGKKKGSTLRKSEDQDNSILAIH
mgnify:CR=1 FL=1